jgi:shikimate kinase
VNVTLIGMPGVGKTATGRRLSRRLGYRFVDVDDVIEDTLGMRLSRAVKEQGEEFVLRIEEESVLSLRGMDNCVVSPGGSVVYSGAAMDFLKENSTVVLLVREPELVFHRICKPDKRGVIWRGAGSPQQLFEERKPLYEKYADYTVEIPAGQDFDAAAKEVIRVAGLKPNPMRVRRF